MEIGEKTTLLNLVYSGVKDAYINEKGEGIWTDNNFGYILKEHGLGYVVVNRYEMQVREKLQ